MMETIIHRGPDGEGVYFDPDKRFNCGFRRLSFIDLADGDQPIYNEDRTALVFFNGEIYNYKELRSELEEKGHIFATNSDTETLVHMYEEYKADMLPRLRGMFAFVIFDINSGELFCARDFFGIKPFYYSTQGKAFLIGSEIKSFLRFPGFKKEVNEEALAHYMTFQYSVLPETFFKGVFKLMPGHYLIYKDGTVTTKRYYSNEFQRGYESPLPETVESIEAVMLDSVRMHKISDVEVGSFLSSGVDSSYIAACAYVDKTFTVGFDYENYNEIEYAKKLSESIGVENYSKMITTDEYWDALPKIQYHMDEPLADPAAVALYFVSELASKYVKGALSGEGADEFFGGYNIYREPMDLKALTSLPAFARKTLGFLAGIVPFRIKGKNFFIRGSKSVEERFIGNANIFSYKERSRLLKNAARINAPAPAELTKKFYNEIKDFDDITKMQYLDINMWLPGDILLKADKMSMAHSLEVRVPYLDKEVFSVARKLPVNLRVSKSATKYAFRKAAENHIPIDVAEKKKLGFPVPIRIWLKEDKYYDKVKEAFTSDAAAGFFNTDKLLKLLDRHKKGRADNSRKIWTAYMFLVWHKEFFA